MSILIVDDDQAVRNTISIILKQNGYTVLEAVDAQTLRVRPKTKGPA
jgi:DNA-binding response OmpR family regulator